MATYTWRASNGGAFDDASNWDPTVVPGAGDTAVFNANGGTIGSAGSVDGLVFAFAGWTIAGQLTANSTNVTSGTLSVYGSVAQLVTSSFAVDSGAAIYLANSGVLSAAQGSFGTGALNVLSRGIGQFSGSLRLGAGGSTAATIDTAVLAVGGVLSLGTIAGSVGNLTVSNGGQMVVNASRDDSQTYLQVAAAASASSTITVTGGNSLLLLSQNSAGIGVAGTGVLNVVNGGTARFNSQNNGLNPALVIGVLQNSGGTVSVSGPGSAIVSGGSVIVGRSGTGVLNVTGGASVTGTSVPSAVAALSVGGAGSGSGTLTVLGAGSQFVASGTAVIGGDNRGNGIFAGGVGRVVLSAGGLLQSNSMTVLAGSSISIDGSSQENVSGDLGIYGSVSSAGTLSVSGAAGGSGTLSLGGGYTGVGLLSQTHVAFTGPNATLRINALSGSTTVTGMQSGDRIDLAGSATISGNTVSFGRGALVLSGGPYALTSDGSGGTYVALGLDTIGVFRFFDSNYGTHFFSSSTSEKSTIMSTRPDLVYEGVGLDAVDPTAPDASASPVYRFFDSNYGTHFFTASASERDTVIANRPDLLFEGTGFLEHVAQQPGDVGVYRFFDTQYGTHFYTADRSEHDNIVATRPDLVDEGIGFYAPNG